MSRPLLISDCDDVLLHFAPHFASWVEEAHGLGFVLDQPGFAGALREPDGTPVARERIRPLLDAFFEREMHRQGLVDGAFDALRSVSEIADIVVLTNIGDRHRAGRVAQLERFDIRHRVICNQGGKGPPVAALVAELGAGPAVFVDDLALHHESVAEHAPRVWRLHMIAEPRVAALNPPAAHAHARIDRWSEALPWILARFAEA